MLTMGMVLCGAMTVSAESDGYVISASHGYGAVEHWEIKTIGMQDAAKDLGVEFNYKYARWGSAAGSSRYRKFC